MTDNEQHTTQIQMGTGEVDTDWLGNMMVARPRTPAGENGGVKITIEWIDAEKPHTVVSLRNALFMGDAPCTCAFDLPLQIRHLGYEGGEWMADTCQEIWQMHEPLERLAEMDEPSLLVGGLGLGVFTHLATEYAGAIATTVEKDERVIALVAKHAARRVLHTDIYEHAREIGPGEYDFAFLDTWQRTGEYAWVREVVPLRRIIGDKIPEILCWNEQEMIGQVQLSGLRAMCVPAQSIPATSTHWAVLREKAEQAGITPTEMGGTEGERMSRVLAQAAMLNEEPAAHGILARFVTEPGSPQWEREFGESWDRHEALAAKWRAEHNIED